jgi:hypothetical protein
VFFLTSKTFAASEENVSESEEALKKVPSL